MEELRGEGDGVSPFRKNIYWPSSAKVFQVREPVGTACKGKAVEPVSVWSAPVYRKVYGKNTAPVGQVDCKYKVTSINLFSFKCEKKKKKDYLLLLAK